MGNTSFILASIGVFLPDMTNLKNIVVSEDNPKYKVVEGALVSKDGKKLYGYPKQKELSEMIQKSFVLRRQSKQLLEYAKQAVEMAIEQGEDAALAWLKDKVE